MKHPAPVTAIVCTDWATDSSGGATFEHDVLAAALRRTDRGALVVYPDIPAIRALVDDAHAGGRVTLVPALATPNIARRLQKRVSRMAGRSAPHLPFADLGGALAAAGAECAWMLGGSQVPLDLPYLATVWDVQHRAQPWFPEVSSNGEWREREQLVREFIARAFRVLTGTAQGAREVEAFYGRPVTDSRVIPFAVPEFARQAGAEERLSRPAEVGERYLLYPASFWAHKNHVTLLHALALLSDDTQLVLVGADRGAMAHVRSTALALGVAERVVFMGHVPRASLIALYQHAEALVYASLFGPDNLPPLEAMALGCPVIASDIPGASEQLGDAALLVSPLSAEAWTSAIRDLRDQPAQRARLVARGHECSSASGAEHYANEVFRIIDEELAPVRALWA